MEYTYLDEICSKMSQLVYGTPGSAIEGDTAAAMRSYDIAWEAGFRVFDTANGYGQGENTLGQWLQSRGYRADAVILDKGCNPRMHGSQDEFSARTIRTQVEESLRRLRTDHVELYLLHRDDPSRGVEEIVTVLNELKQEGKILRFGGSNWSLERFQQANAFAAANGLAPFSASSPAFSLLRYIRDPWGASVSVSGPEGKPYRDWLKQENIPMLCYSSLARGYLSGKFRTRGDKPIEVCIRPEPIIEYDAPENRARLARAEDLAAELGATVPQVALAWLLAQDQQVFPILTPSSEKHIFEMESATRLHLTPEQCRWLFEG